MKKRDLSEIEKRDRRIEPFDVERLLNSVARAFAEVGVSDRGVSQRISGRVMEGLKGRLGVVSLPSTRDAFELTVEVLTSSGHEAVARAYESFREDAFRKRVRHAREPELPGGTTVRREPKENEERAETAPTGQDFVARIRGTGTQAISRPTGCPAPKALAAGEPTPADEPRVGRELVVDAGDFGVSSWSRQRLAAALERDASLAPATAESVATAVERRLLARGVRRVSTSILRSLVDAELFDRGLLDTIDRRRRIGITPGDLDRWVFGRPGVESFRLGAAGSDRVQDRIAKEVLTEYSLSAVYSSDVVTAHRQGRIYLHGLASPLEVERLAWNVPVPFGVTAFGATGFGATGSGAMGDLGSTTGDDGVGRERRRIGDREQAPLRAAHARRLGSYLDTADFERVFLSLTRCVSDGWRISNASRVLESRAPTGATDRADRRRALLDFLASSSSVTCEFEVSPSERGVDWLNAWLSIPFERTRRHALVVTVRAGEGSVVTGTSSPAEASVREAFATRLAAALERGDRAIFDRRHSDETPYESDRGWLEAVLGRVTLNWPGIVYRASRAGSDGFERELQAALDLAVRAALERRHFVDRLAEGPAAPLWKLFGCDARGRAVSTRSESISAVGVAGFDEGVRALTGRSLHECAEARAVGRDLLTLVHEKVEGENRRLGLRLRLEETHAQECLDHFRVANRQSAAEGDAASAPDTPYTGGIRFARACGSDPLARFQWVAQCAAWVAPTGGLFDPDFRVEGSGGPGVVCGVIAEIEDWLGVHEDAAESDATGSVGARSSEFYG